MTRIIAGELGGRRLATLPGAETRPTSERTREALFSSLDATHDLDEGPFLDLFAGSGAVGLEALSRGAPRAVFVESAKPAAAVISRNIRQLGVADRAEVIVADAQHAPGRLGGLNAMTVFCDPPYSFAAHTLAELIDELVRVDAAHPDGLLVVERDRRDGWQWPASVEGLRDRRYGESVLWYGRRL